VTPRTEPIVEEIPSDSITIAELGWNHFFKDSEIHIKTVGLTDTILRLMEGYLEQPNKAFHMDWPRAAHR
jgi:hypothetical protein